MTHTAITEGVTSLDDMVANHIRYALSQAGGKISGSNGAAAMLGMNPSTLRNKMRKLKIDFGRSSKQN